LISNRTYIDTSVISRLSDPLHGNDFDVTDVQAEALLQICGSGIELVTSKKMLDEVLASKNLKQRALLALVATLAAKGPYTELHLLLPVPFGGAAYGGAAYGGVRIVSDPVLDELRSIFDSADAEHILLAFRNDCRYFLTLDDSTILGRAKSHRAKLEEICPGLLLVNPEDLATLLHKVE
jgi:hypothetical protein